VLNIKSISDNDPVDGKFGLFEKPITDQLINTELNLPQGEEYRKARVVGRAKDMNGNIVGEYDENPS